MSNSAQMPENTVPPLASTPEGIEQQLYIAAANLAYKQLLDGTATSQLITQCLAYGGTRAGLEQGLLRARTAKTESEVKHIEAQANFEQVAKDAMAAFSVYRGETTTYVPEELLRAGQTTDV